MKKIDELILIGAGKQAEIFEWEKERVLRLFFKDTPEEIVRQEAFIMKTLNAMDLPVPEFFELIELEGRRGIVMERIRGKDLLSEITKNPLALGTIAKKLAHLQYKMHTLSLPAGFPVLKTRLGKQILGTPLLSLKMKEFVMNVLNGLPEGKALCHGDFNPVNILFKGTEMVIIDWAGAGTGDPLADVAYTLYLLTKPPLPPGSTFFQKILSTMGRGVLANSYFKFYNRKSAIDAGLLYRWQIIRAAERLSYGISEEQKFLFTFLEKNFKVYQSLE